MNGAESVLRTLAGSGVSVCFADPGTSEMHLVAALDCVSAIVGALLPDDAVVVDEAITASATGAAGRPVSNLEADGSAMYTIQSLWTQAREGLDVTTIIIANRSYAILEYEFLRVGAEGDGRAAHELMDIGRPELSFVGLASSMGVPARRVDDVPGMVSALREALSSPGPRLIEAVA